MTTSHAIDTSCRRALPHQRHHFTIVELVVVMVIIAVLMGFSLSTYRTASRAYATGSAATDISSKITHARQLAITRRAHVAVIMPGSAGTGLKPEYQYRVYRTAYVDKTAGDYVFVRWTDTSEWSFMPDRTSIMEADDDIGIHDGLYYVKVPDESNITKVDDVNLSERLGGGGTAANVRAIVFSPSGKLKGRALYVTVGQATYDGSTWDIINPAATPKNVSSSDQTTLEINRFTGHVRHITPDAYP